MDNLEFLTLIHHLDVAANKASNSINEKLQTTKPGATKVSVLVEGLTSVEMLLITQRSVIRQLVEENETIRDTLEKLSNQYAKE